MIENSIKETWKRHPSWGIEVSNLGRVRANGRTKKLSLKVYKGKKSDLKYHVTSVGGRGYPVLKVSRLVLETFRGPCPPGMECRHLNSSSTDDRLRNLTWGTREQQIADQKRAGTFSKPPILLGAKNPSYRHTPEAYEEAKILRAEGRTSRQVAKLTGISKSQLLRRWRAVERCYG